MVRTGVVILAFLVVGATGRPVAHGQSLDFRIDGPTEIDEGEYVELRVEFPEGVAADVSFVPVEEDRFGVHPILRESVVDGKLVLAVRGRVCTFSARCQGERRLTVVATAFASVDGVPRVHSLRHRIHVKSAAEPAPRHPPQDPPPPPKDDDDLGPRVPLPGAARPGISTPGVALPAGDLDKIVRILGNVVDRLEALEARASVPVATAMQPATTNGEILSPPDDVREGRVPAIGFPATGPAAIDLPASDLPASGIPAPAPRYVAPWANECPGGVCPTPSRSSSTTGPLGVIRWRR